MRKSVFNILIAVVLTLGLWAINYSWSTENYDTVGGIPADDNNTSDPAPDSAEKKKTAITRGYISFGFVVVVSIFWFVMRRTKYVK